MDVVAILGVMVPISAIVLGIGSDIVKRVLKSQERRLEMRLQAQQGQNEEVTRQLKTLHDEIASLRDTSTQFDLSFDEALGRLEGRVNRLETKNAVSTAPATEAGTTLRNGQSQ